MIEVDRRENTALCTAIADSADKGTRVDVGDRDDRLLDQVMREGLFGAVVARDAAILAHDEASDVRLRGLAILPVDPHVSDHRIRHGDDLATVARIGQDLLVARQRGIEDDFAVLLAIGTDRYPFVDRSVFQCQEPAFALVTHLRSSPACDLIKLI